MWGDHVAHRCPYSNAHSYSDSDGYRNRHACYQQEQGNLCAMKTFFALVFTLLVATYVVWNSRAEAHPTVTPTATATPSK
jgi:hypothetical protein